MKKKYFILFFLIVSNLFSQNKSGDFRDIVGYVTDKDGNGVSGAIIKVTSPPGPSTTSEEDGTFHLPLQTNIVNFNLDIKHSFFKNKNGYSATIAPNSNGDNQGFIQPSIQLDYKDIDNQYVTLKVCDSINPLTKIKNATINSKTESLNDKKVNSFKYTRFEIDKKITPLIDSIEIFINSKGYKEYKKKFQFKGQHIFTAKLKKLELVEKPQKITDSIMNSIIYRKIGTRRVVGNDLKQLANSISELYDYYKYNPNDSGKSKHLSIIENEPLFHYIWLIYEIKDISTEEKSTLNKFNIKKDSALNTKNLLINLYEKLIKMYNKILDYETFIYEKTDIEKPEFDIYKLNLRQTKANLEELKKL